MKSIPRNDVREGPFVWTRGTAARETLRHLDRNGIDAEPLLVKGGAFFPSAGCWSSARSRRTIRCWAACRG